MEAWGASVAQKHIESSGEEVMESFGSPGVDVAECSGLHLQNCRWRVTDSEGSSVSSNSYA